MAYADFNYYLNDYRGNTVPSEEFSPLSERASDFMDTVTFDKLKNQDTSEFTDKIKKCCCALTEFIYQTKNTENSKESEKIGSYSVTFREVSDEKIHRKMYGITMQYIGCTGLMFRGV